ncbi:hypothetical protein AGMMS49574_23210 [Bacteroidia bacterium]|nr:hypothetical protein AGMMS49574_23210 [Bacteroidia bacterium]
MDQNDAIRMSRAFLEKIRQTNMVVLDVWLFGSYAKGTYNEDSDIDLAIVLSDSLLSFDTDVRLMTLRKGEETMIETHTYSKEDFQSDTPMMAQIKKYGFRL